MEQTKAVVADDELELDEDKLQEEASLDEMLDEESADLAILQEKIAKLEQEAKSSMDRALRAAAELENIRKRAKQDVAKAHKFAIEAFVDSLLPVLDSLEPSS